MSTKEFKTKTNAASILREIVSRVIDYPAHKIKLSGEIQPDHSWHEDAGHSWWRGASEDYFTIYGFSPEEGLTQMDIRMSRAYSQNGQRQPEGESETLAEYCKRTETNPIFIVQAHSGKEYGDSGEEFYEVTIFKTPDFAQYWAELEEKDTARWENWLA